MKIKKSLAFVAVIAAAAAWSSVAFAQPMQSTSSVYFDESGNMVGQSILFCSGNPLSLHGGNVHTPYHVDTSVPCSLCSQKSGNVGSCPTPDYIVPKTVIVAYTLPTVLNITQACISMDICDVRPWEVPATGWTYTAGVQ